MTGFSAQLFAAIRKRPRERAGIPLDELEEMAGRAAADRRDFIAAVRRLRSDSLPGPPPPEPAVPGALRLIPVLAGADPATDETFPDLDPARIAADLAPAGDGTTTGKAGQFGVAALAVCTEPDFYRGHAELLESARSAAELPVLRLDGFPDPRAVLEALTWPVDALLLDPIFLGRESVNESLALARSFSAGAVLLLRTASDAGLALAENPPAVLIDRRDPATLALRAGIVDRMLEALEDYAGIRLATGGFGTAAAVTAAARRPVDGVLLAKSLSAGGDLKSRLEALRKAAEASRT